MKNKKIRKNIRKAALSAVSFIILVTGLTVTAYAEDQPLYEYMRDDNYDIIYDENGKPKMDVKVQWENDASPAAGGYRALVTMPGIDEGGMGAGFGPCTAGGGPWEDGPAYEQDALSTYEGSYSVTLSKYFEVDTEKMNEMYGEDSYTVSPAIVTKEGLQTVSLENQKGISGTCQHWNLDDERASTVKDWFLNTFCAGMEPKPAYEISQGKFLAGLCVKLKEGWRNGLPDEVYDNDSMIPICNDVYTAEKTVFKYTVMDYIEDKPKKEVPVLGHDGQGNPNVTVYSSRITIPSLDVSNAAPKIELSFDKTKYVIQYADYKGDYAGDSTLPLDITLKVNGREVTDAATLSKISFTNNKIDKFTGKTWNIADISTDGTLTLSGRQSGIMELSMSYNGTESTNKAVVIIPGDLDASGSIGLNDAVQEAAIVRGTVTPEDISAAYGEDLTNMNNLPGVDVDDIVKIVAMIRGISDYYNGPVSAGD